MNRAVAITFLGNLASPLSALAIAPILARALGIDGRGEVAAATAPLLLCMAALTLGLPESITYHVAGGGPLRRRAGALALLAACGVVGVAAAFLFSGFLSAGDSALAQLMVVATLGLIPALIVSGLRSEALGQGLWWTIAIERLGSGILRVVAVYGFFFAGALTPTTAALSIAVTTWVGGAAYLFGSRRSRVSTTESAPSIGQLLGYGARIWIGSIAGILLMRLDQLLLTPLAGVTALGVYAVAVNVSEIILVFNSAVRDVVFATAGMTRNADDVATASRISTALTLSLGIVLAALSPWVIPWVFGADFDSAVLPAVILIAAVVIGNPGSVAGAGLSAFGYPGRRSIAIVCGLIANVVALIPLASALGASGAAWATFIGNLVAGGGSAFGLSAATGVSFAAFIGLRASDIALMRSIATRFLRRGRG